MASNDNNWWDWIIGIVIAIAVFWGKDIIHSDWWKSINNKIDGVEVIDRQVEEQQNAISIPESAIAPDEAYSESNASNNYSDNRTTEHDFLTAVFMNPEADYATFYGWGMNRNNTTLQSANFYVNKKKIKEYFKNDAEFYTFYNNVKIAYNYFISDDTKGRQLVEFPYSSRNIDAPADALRGNAYQRNFCFANYPSRLHRKPQYNSSSSYSELESSNEELKNRVEELEQQLRRSQ